jgi:hypothetical protein
MTCLISLIPSQHGAELDELRPSHAGNDFGKRSLAGAGRSPENQRSQIVALNLRPQGLARRNQMLLADVLIERARTHPVSQRIAAIPRIGRVRNRLK